MEKMLDSNGSESWSNYASRQDWVLESLTIIDCGMNKERIKNNNNNNNNTNKKKYYYYYYYYFK